MNLIYLKTIIILLSTLYAKDCEEIDKKRILPFFRLYQLKYNLLTTQKNMFKSPCSLEIKEKEYFYIIKIDEFDEPCELRLEIREEDKVANQYDIDNFYSENKKLIDGDEKKIINNFEMVNSTLQGLAAILEDKRTFFKENWEKNCKNLLNQELYFRRMKRIKDKLKKDIMSLINNIGPNMKKNGHMITTAYLSKDEHNLNLSLIDFFFINLKDEYGEIYIRYKTIILSMIPTNKEEILRMMKEEFGKVRDLMLRNAAHNFTSYTKTLAEKIIAKKTQMSEENIKEIEEVFNVFFPNAGKTVENYVFNILFKIEQSFENFPKNYKKQIQTFENDVIKFKDSIKNILHNFSDNLKVILAKVFRKKWVDCSYNEIAQVLVEELIHKNILLHNIYSENFYACKEKLNTESEDEKTFRLIFSFNKAYCEILVIKNFNSIRYEENMEKNFFSKLSCLDLKEIDYKFSLGFIDLADDNDGLIYY